jgi:hypothetical protein
MKLNLPTWFGLCCLNGLKTRNSTHIAIESSVDEFDYECLSGD